MKELVIKVNEFSTNSKRLTVDFAMIKDKQEQCLRELDEMQAENNKIKEEIKVFNQEAQTNKENLIRLQQKKCSI